MIIYAAFEKKISLSAGLTLPFGCIVVLSYTRTYLYECTSTLHVLSGDCDPQTFGKLLSSL